MKKLLSLLAAAVMVLPFVSAAKVKAVNFPLEEPIQSESAVLINLDSNMVIHEKNADVKQMPGPLVNIMTAVVCLENCEDLDEKVTIDEYIELSKEFSSERSKLFINGILDKLVLELRSQGKIKKSGRGLLNENSEEA